MDSTAKLARMIQPETLRSSDYQQTVRTLVARDANLANCDYEYFTPIRFAVRLILRYQHSYPGGRTLGTAERMGTS